MSGPRALAAPPLRLLLVDDQALVRTGLRMVLDAKPDFEVVGEASEGREAIYLAAVLKPDIIIMDVRMPGMNGIDATQAIVAATPSCRIIVLTTFDLDEHAFAALRAGASGFLLKDARPDELASAIRSVARGEAAISPRITRRMLQLFGSQLPAEDEAESRSKNESGLTPREREILLAIGDGLSNGELAARFFLSESTIKTHVGRIFLKLQLRDRVHAVIYVYEHPELRSGR
jgi:DNA-binding NarL/FixJ family response regulator